MTTLQDRIIEKYRERFNSMDKFGTIYSKDNSIPLLEHSSNQLEAIEQFLIQSIKEVQEETRKEYIEQIEKWLINNGITHKKSFVALFNYLKSITNKDKQ